MLVTILPGIYFEYEGAQREESKTKNCANTPEKTFSPSNLFLIDKIGITNVKSAVRVIANIITYWDRILA